MSENASQVFRTHSNYINAISYLASDGILDDSNDALNVLASRVYESGCLNFDIDKRIDIEQLHHILNNAWGIESLFKIENKLITEDDLIRLSNNWCIVQTYYILFYCTQALAVASGHPKPVTHPQVHRAFYQIWSVRNKKLIPWSVTFNENGYNNLPEGIIVDEHIHSWTKVEKKTALSIYCKALRTTRDEYIDEALTRRRNRLSAKKEKKTVRLSDEDKLKTISRIRPTSLISYIFRLKRRTNYEQSSALALGPINEYQSRELRNNLRSLIDSTLLITEFIVSKKLGEDIYYDWCREWNEIKLPTSQVISPENRFDIIF